MADLIATGIGGTPIGQLYVGEKSYDMTARFPAKSPVQPGCYRQLGAEGAVGRASSALRRGAHRHGFRRNVIVREMARRNIIVAG
ncbi:CzcA family heavy metal efflux pump [Alicycliphilus sp. B1]|nr:CzcA family heavy metal efflux pump [Alicycliphilus sp. B1]